MSNTDSEPLTHPDTEPPAADNHGWLEQFSHFSHASFDELKSIVETGIHATERVMLMKVALKLFAFAVHDAKDDDFTPEQKSEIESLILELETTLHLPQ